MRPLATALASLATLALFGQRPTLPPVSESTLRAHLAFLSDDLLEGRGTGQRGGDLAARYLETQVQRMGLKPGNGTSFRQPVRINGVKALPEASQATFTGPKGSQGFAFGTEWLWSTGATQATLDLDAPLVFAGYGIVAPEEGWDDYAGLDAKGKVVVVLVNDPPPTAAEPERFGGRSLTYYGRWTYKLEEARRHGATGVLMVHTLASATYGFELVKASWGKERFQLQGEGNPLQGWLSEPATRALFALGGQDFDALQQAAAVKGFRARPLGVQLRGHLTFAIRPVEQVNIAALVPGTDPVLQKEVVIYSAHYDHLGKGEGPGDQIWNGAIDNASGSAALLAMAEVALKAPGKRSQMFLWVCAEEQGLLGSEAYAQAPLWPLSKTVAALNLDSLNFSGPARDIGLEGSERSGIFDLGESIAQSMGLKGRRMGVDAGGGYFRSDHFSFAKAGVPAFSVGGGADFLQPEVSGPKAKAYGARYHQVTDEYDPTWDLSGMVTQAQFALALGRALADTATPPTWRAGDPFGEVQRRNRALGR